MTEIQAPGLARRLAAFVYEGVLLFGVLFIAACLFFAVTQQRQGTEGVTIAHYVFLFLLVALYFSWFWTHGGQTVAMKAWHLRVVGSDGRPLTRGRAVARFLLSWLWFLPALASAHYAGLKGWSVLGCVLAGVAAYALIARLHPSRQFLHDLLCGTRLVTQMPSKNKQ